MNRDFDNRNRMFLVFLKDVVIMGAALEKAFYEKLAEMPSDVWLIDVSWVWRFFVYSK